MKHYLILLIAATLLPAQNITVSLDLGGSDFFYLEKIYAQIEVTNESTNILKLRKTDNINGPKVQFILLNSKNEIFPFNPIITHTIIHQETIFYILEQGQKITFPIKGRYYDLSNYYKKVRTFDRHLPVGDYRIKAQIKLNKKVYESDYKKFSVSAIENRSAFDLFKQAKEIYFQKTQTNRTISLFNELYSKYPNSFYNVLAIGELDYLIRARKKYYNNININNDDLINRILVYLLGIFPNRRHIFIETKWLLVGNEKKEFWVNKISNDLKNMEFRNKIINMVQETHHPYLKIDKVKNSNIMEPCFNKKSQEK